MIQKFTSDRKFSEILTGSTIALSARVVAAVLALITSIIVARLYGAEMTGILAMINSFLMLTTIFTLLGTSTSMLRFIP
jgi:O-antigen/teichoic acid export membrane protein